jgi:hypothetical protein
MARLEFAAIGKNNNQSINRTPSLILTPFGVVVRQTPCEKDQILIRSRISGVLTRKPAPKNKRTVFKCIFYGEKPP